MPRYQNKYQQTTDQTKSHYTIQQESKGFWDWWRLPVQLCPSPINPDLPMHTYDPFVLLHVASLWHLPMNASHLSVVKLGRKKDQKKNTWININYRYKHFDFYQTAIGTQQLSNSRKPQFICSFLLLVVLWPYFSIKLLFLSSPCSYYIKHSTYVWTALILPWKASNIQDK